MPPGRFRSKTSDISDLLRGGSSKHLDTPPVPQALPAESVTPTKGKRKLNFLRKRKSGSVSPSPSPSSTKSTGSGSGNHPSPEDVPPLPDLPSRFSTNSQAVSSRDSTTLPSSLPPVNVSPPSFGHFSQFSSKSRASDVSQTPDPGRPSTVKRFQTLRGQKSTSFEFAGRQRHAKTDSRGSGRPTITISPPKAMQDDDLFTSPPRTAPPPPTTIPRPSRFSRKPVIMPFITKHSEKVDSPPSPSTTTSPPLPPTMHFPLPPEGKAKAVAIEQTQLPTPKSDKFVLVNKDFTTISSPNSVSFGEPVTPPALHEQGSEHDNILNHNRNSLLQLPDASELSPTRGRFLSSPSAPTPSLGSDRPSTSASAKSLPGHRPPPLRLSIRRSRSPSPAGTPPSSPLPPLPMEGAEGSPIQSRSPSLQSPQSLQAIPSIPSFPTALTRRSFTSIPQKMFRSRAHTVDAPPTKRPSSIRMAPPLPHGITAKLEDRDNEAELGHCMPHFVHGKHHHDRESQRDSLVPTEDLQVKKANRASLTEPLSLVHSRPSGCQQSHDIVRTLKELHAAEKAELLQRIEQLEREARKRERELKGLRWLLLNGNNPIGTSGTMPSPGRIRSSSKSSQSSHASSIGKHHKKIDTGPPAFSALYSPRGSTEEGLYELQSTISDLIAPSSSDSPPQPAIPSPDEDAVSRSPSGIPTRRLKRSNTLPLPDGPPEIPLAKLIHTKQARRTSSPVIPATISPSASSSRSRAGLGIEMHHSIPSIPGSDSHLSNTSSAMSLPSLSSTNTASSALSAIPEFPQGVPAETDKEREKREKEERRASRALKRLSASSTASSLVGTTASAQVAYANNLKIGHSPSISQVLDSKTDDSDIEDVLQKLRAFSST
ncbi:hypothetical protein C8Q75DRAFT_467766 [Abortiporus biennis]|nr:hypothetical protein C8Q75DRAFT_467766 [Abortiporus biennis]